MENFAPRANFRLVENSPKCIGMCRFLKEICVAVDKSCSLIHTEGLFATYMKLICCTYELSTLSLLDKQR